MIVNYDEFGFYSLSLEVRYLGLKQLGEVSNFQPCIKVLIT